MKTKNPKALILFCLLTCGVYSICPAFMYLQSKEIDARVARLNKASARSLAVLTKGNN